jgi:hypothetical protein
MKKQSVKKLVLAKETLRDLEALTLGRVAGGSLYPQCPTYYNSCGYICQEEYISYNTNCGC